MTGDKRGEEKTLRFNFGQLYGHIRSLSRSLSLYACVRVLPCMSMSRAYSCSSSREVVVSWEVVAR